MTVPQPLLHARNRYLAKGVPPGGAVALPSVLYYESKLNPGSQGYQSTEHGGVLNPHGAYGIASWNGPRDQSKVGDPLYDRQAALLAYAMDGDTQHHLQVDALDTQLDFVLTEIANNYPKSWAAIRSSASYKSIIPIIVDEYENPKDKQKEIDAAMVIAAALAAVPEPQEPQPAPPVPVVVTTAPQVPGPQPPVVQTAPQTPAGLPPISAMEAGLDAAILDNIGAWRDALLQQRDALDKRIAALETAAADFGKLAPMIVPMVLPKPAVEPAVTPPPQTTQRYTMNPQVSATIRSILLAFGGAAVSKGVIDQNTLVSIVGGAVSAISYGWSLWNHTTTGTIAAAAALPEVQKIIAPSSISDSPTFAANPKVVSH